MPKNQFLTSPPFCSNPNEAQAQFEQAYAHAKGQGQERNRDLALQWLKKAAEQGLCSAQLSLGFYYFFGADKKYSLKLLNKWLNFQFKGETEEIPLDLAVHMTFYDDKGQWIKASGGAGAADAYRACAWFKNAADQGCAEAQFWLGRCYSDGLGLEQNGELAIECYKKSARQGFAEAAYWLARCYFEGLGIGQNETQAQKWLGKAVELSYHYFQATKYGMDYGKGCAEAYLLMGELYALGKVVEKNDELAFMWYEKAADQGIAEAQFRVANFYVKGRGVAQNYEAAIEWWEKASLQGHEQAKNWLAVHYFGLGMLHFQGEAGFAQNDGLAFALFTKSAELGCAEAYLFLGILYNADTGANQSDRLAFEYYQKAVSQFDRVHGDNPAKLLANKLLADCYALGKGVEKNVALAEHYRQLGCNTEEYAQMLVEGLMDSAPKTELAKEFLHFKLNFYITQKEYDLAKEFVEKFFEHTEGIEKSFKTICLTTIEQAKEIDKKNQELEEKNKALELKIKQENEHQKALHEKEKEMLSFFTHTMRNALATAPESLRQAIHLLGSDIYGEDTKHYQAINKICFLFSTLSLTDCLIDTYKQSISDPDEFKQSWIKDHSGEANPRWVIAWALRQALNRIIFMSDTTELRKILDSPDTALVKATRKSFIDGIFPLNIDSQGVEHFYDWTAQHFKTIKVDITDSEDLNFGLNQIRFSLLFAMSSELILNALKYWDGGQGIEISWYLADKDTYVFSVKNSCKKNAASNLAGTHKGLAFIKRLMELLGEDAQFICKTEAQSFSAELQLNKNLFKGTQ